MNTTGNLICDSLKLGMGYADRLLTDVTADKFARFADPGGAVIESNHACFIFGHLALYPSRIISGLGGNATEPAGFNELFSKDAKCADDPNGSIYPAMDVVIDAFRDGYGNVVTALQSASDDALSQPNPNDAMRAKFQTLGSMYAFYCGGHLMMHLGQLSAWRRMMGLGPA